MYADDLVLFSRSRFHLQQALATLTATTREIGLAINRTKTEAIKFRKGGRLAVRDELHLEGNALKYVSAFVYLGVTLTPTGTSFSRHIRDRVRKAQLAMATIKTPQKLSIRTALQLFSLKIAPTAAYGIQAIWRWLSKSDLERLESVKA